jgi:electron transport complex protein RnfE
MEQKHSLQSIFFNGIITENPTFRLVLGTCPTMAVTTNATNGIGMGAAATFVLVGSNVVFRCCGIFIPDKIRIPAFIVVICTFVTMVQMFMNCIFAGAVSKPRYLPAAHRGQLHHPCARGRRYASKNPVFPAPWTALAWGLVLRWRLRDRQHPRALWQRHDLWRAGVRRGLPADVLLILPAGGFIVYGLLLALFNA